MDFIDQFKVPCFKIASASMTDDALIRYTRRKASTRPIFLATGMSDLEQVDHAVALLGRDNLVVMHTCSVYPSVYEDLNLRVIPSLRERFGIPVGYSGHETGFNRWRRLPWGPAWWNGTSPWTEQCGAAIRLPLWRRAV